jgi:hypothetical protein
MFDSHHSFLLLSFLCLQADGIEIGWHRFVCSLEILDVVREKMRLPLPHVAYLQGDAGSEQVVSFDTYDTFFFYDAGTWRFRDARAITVANDSECFNPSYIFRHLQTCFRVETSD